MVAKPVVVVSWQSTGMPVPPWCQHDGPILLATGGSARALVCLKCWSVLKVWEDTAC